MFSRLGVFIGCEGECREALIAGELEGVLFDREEQDGKNGMSGCLCNCLLAIIRLRARSNNVAS